MAATPAAALPRMLDDTALIPAMSTTEYIMAMSDVPTYALTSPAAIVDTRSFGKPIGSCRIA